MGKKNFWLGILVMALVFGMTVVGCDNDPTNNDPTNGNKNGFKGDTALNGTWVDQYGIKTKFNNGNFEMESAIINSSSEAAIINSSGSAGGIETTTVDIFPWAKGNYTTDGSYITLTATHVYGRDLGLQEKWYSKNDLKKAFPGSDIDSEFLPVTGNYSISGNTLTLALFNREPRTYTKM